MLPRNHPDRIVSLSTTTGWWPMPGCSFRPPSPITWACGNSFHLDLGVAPGRANTGDKMLTLVASALAGGDCIRCAARRWDGPHPGRHDQGASTLGTFLAVFAGATSVNWTG